MNDFSLKEWQSQANEVLRAYKSEIVNLKLKIQEQENLLREIPSNFIEQINILRKKLNMKELIIKDV